MCRVKSAQFSSVTDTPEMDFDEEAGTEAEVAG